MSADPAERHARVVERAVQPLAELNQINDDEAIRDALTETVELSRTASAPDRAVIDEAVRVRLAVLRAVDEWSPEQRDAEIAAARVRADDWPEPIPLTAYARLPSFPLEALPSWLRDWAGAEAHATQTPPDMAAMLGLAAVATASQRVMVVRVRDGWTEPPSIYTAIVLPPGNRKSAVVSDAREPLDAYEIELAGRLMDEVARSQDALNAAKKRLDRAIDYAARTHGPERVAAEADMRDARDQLNAAEGGVVVAPRLSCADCTQEALARLLAQHGESIALLDAEGCGPLAIMAGRYTDGIVAIDLYLRAHAGDVYRSDRLGRDPIVLRRPALTIAVTTQPDMLRQLGERREMRALGLVARFLWVVPVSMVGRRSSDPPPMAARVRQAYAAHVRALLGLERREDGEPHAVQLSAAAWVELRGLMDRLEPRLGPGGDLESIADWACKLAGAVVRIAALLHAAVHADCPWAAEIAPETMRHAIAIGEYLLEHARAALGELGADPASADAEYVRAWMVARGVKTISRRDLHRELRGRFKKARDLEPAIELLAERDWIRVHSNDGERRTGRKASPTIELNPRAKSAGHNGRNGENGAEDSSSVHSVHSVLAEASELEVVL